MDFRIREANATDMVKVMELINELAVFEKESNAVELEVEDLINDGFREKKLFHCFVATVNETVVGMALTYPRYSTWKGPALHLEDLIVSKDHRGSGIGSALLGEVVKYGHYLGVKRIGWEVLDWNERAISLYEKKGANVLRDWDVVQLDEVGIKNFLRNIDQ